jgi:hypothetical protein
MSDTLKAIMQLRHEMEELKNDCVWEAEGSVCSLNLGTLEKWIEVVKSVEKQTEA